MKRSVLISPRSFQQWAAGLFLGLSLTSLAPAAIVVTSAENHDASTNGPAVNAGTPLAVSATDLVNNGQTSLLSVTSSGFSSYTGPGASGTSSIPVLNDGSGGGWNLNASGTAVTVQSTPWSVTYNLNVAATTGGYTLTGIDVMSLWTNDFVNQRYTVEISTLTVPAFTALTGPVVVDTSTSNSANNIGSSLQSSIRDTTGALANGVTAIRFTFSPENNPGGSPILAAYREVDVFGLPTIPEPSSWALTLLAAGACALRRRRA